MIVADTNIISYLLLPTDYSDKASQLFKNQRDNKPLSSGIHDPQPVPALK
jgi:hypothetical protein